MFLLSRQVAQWPCQPQHCDVAERRPLRRGHAISRRFFGSQVGEGWVSCNPNVLSVRGYFYIGSLNLSQSIEIRLTDTDIDVSLEGIVGEIGFYQAS